MLCGGQINSVVGSGGVYQRSGVSDSTSNEADNFEVTGEEGADLIQPCLKQSGTGDFYVLEGNPMEKTATDVLSIDSGSNGSGNIVNLIVNELLNPDFNAQTRRLASIVKEPYRQILEPFIFEPYPLNAVGTFARLVSDHLESFVNVGMLIRSMRLIITDPVLKNIFERATTDINSFKIVRSALRQAIHVIGDMSYRFEWQDAVTFDNIDTLLEGLAAYSEHNAMVADQAAYFLKDRLAKEISTVVLDVGSGLGGTSGELLKKLALMKEQGLIPEGYQQYFTIILYDVSGEQLRRAAGYLKDNFGFSNTILISGSFADVEDKLKEYRGGVNLVVSGAAICHVIRKGVFFKKIYDLMGKGSVLSFWDPAMSMFQAHYVKIGSGNDTYITYVGSSGYSYTIKKGDVLSVDAVKRLENEEYQTTATVPNAEFMIYVDALLHMYLGQMGFSEANVGAGEITSLKEKLRSDMIKEADGGRGFNFIDWLKDNIVENDVYKISHDKWTPYDLIEAVSDKKEYDDAIVNAGFVNYSSKRGSSAKNGENTSIRSALVYFYAEKS